MSLDDHERHPTGGEAPGLDDNGLKEGRPPDLGRPPRLVGGDLFLNRVASGMSTISRRRAHERRVELFGRMREIDEVVAVLADERIASIEELVELRDSLWPAIPWQRGRRPPAIDAAPLPAAPRRAIPIAGVVLRRAALQVLARHGADVRRGGPADGAALSPAPHGTSTPAAAANPRAASRDAREQVVDEAPGRLELHEERLVAQKELREVGEVRVHTEVEEVPARAEAEVLREQLRLQHVPVNEVVKDRVSSWEEDGTYIVPVYEERLVLTKELVLREYLRIERVPTTETRQVEDTVRRERLVVDDAGLRGQVREESAAPEERAQPGGQRAQQRQA